MSIIQIRAALELALDAITGIIPSVGVVSSSNGSPAIFKTAVPHLLVGGVQVTLSGHSGVGAVPNGTYGVLPIDALTFSLLGVVSKSAIASTATGVGGVIKANLTAWEGVTFAPPSVVPYQRVFLVPATPGNPTMGGTHVREVGFMQVTLYYPVQRGTFDIMTRAELIRSTFQRGSAFTNGEITVHIFKTPSINPAQIDDEKIYCIMRIPYWADIFN